MLYFTKLDCGHIVQVYSDKPPLPGETCTGVIDRTDGQRVEMAGQVLYFFN